MRIGLRWLRRWTMTQTCPSDLSPIITPELDQPDPGTVDLKPWRAPIRKAMRTHGTDAIGGALIAAWELRECRIDDVLPGGRLRRALDEMLEKEARNGL